uniref:Uncharacterized protein n=1 Tax=Oryza brachyantha TaxID=4533 RepID=J3LDF4_ORYBR
MAYLAALSFILISTITLTSSSISTINGSHNWWNFNCSGAKKFDLSPVISMEFGEVIGVYSRVMLNSIEKSPRKFITSEIYLGTQETITREKITIIRVALSIMSVISISLILIFWWRKCKTPKSSTRIIKATIDNEITIGEETEETIDRQVEHPSPLASFEQITTSVDEKTIALFLDYNRTLSPIVENPERDFMSHECSMKDYFGRVQ